VRLEHLGELDQRLELGRLGLLHPAAQVLLGGVGVELVEIVEPQCLLVRAHGLERMLQQLIEPVQLLGGQVLRPLEPQVAGVLQ
jgi:hypothetical protein